MTIALYYKNKSEYTDAWTVPQEEGKLTIV